MTGLYPMIHHMLYFLPYTDDRISVSVTVHMFLFANLSKFLGLFDLKLPANTIVVFISFLFYYYLPDQFLQLFWSLFLCPIKDCAFPSFYNPSVPILNISE